MTTIRDVAKQCGLSAMTVSAVLNNRRSEASPETRARVLRVVEEMGYRPNAIARGLSRRRMNTLGVVMSYEGNPSLAADRYLGPILDGIFAANKRHHQKTLVIPEDTWDDACANLLSYLDGHCDGLIFILPIVPTEAFDLIQHRGVPFVVVGESRSEALLSYVDLDNFQAGLEATQFLIDQGHRRIAYLKGEDFLRSSSQRETGYRQALAGAHLEIREEWILPGDYNAGSGYERMLFLLDRKTKERPTALFCGDDGIARGALRALAERGLRVPEEMSLIGINDDRESVDLVPSLTTIRQPLHLIGEEAVGSVIRRISKKEHMPEKTLIGGDLIVRRSVGPPCVLV